MEVSSDTEAAQDKGVFPKLAHCVLSSYCPTVMVLVCDFSLNAPSDVSLLCRTRVSISRRQR